MTDSNDSAVSAKPFQPRCLVIDLEVGKKDGRLQQIGALRADTDERLHWQGGEPAAGLDRLDALADGAAFVLGHNIIGFDLPQLAALRPGLRLLALPAIDTLRLNPLAFPRNPYHHLVKHYQEGPLASGYRNNPLKDAELALNLFRDQQYSLHALNADAPHRLAAWHWLTTQDDVVSGMNNFFVKLRDKKRPTHAEARDAIFACLDGQSCQTQRDEVLTAAENNGWPLAYALAWLSVAGGNSVMPPWVRHQFPQAGEIVRRLRDTACTDPACAWCREHHDAKKALQHWFDFSDFRPEPADAEGRPLQQTIVEATMAGRHVLGILPTGTGKSVCYQIPALSRFDKTGALTVVISPLVALMADQVAGLMAKNIQSCAALNGLLSMPERADVLDRVRLGDIGILIVSPEQLRNRSLRRVLEQREIGAWVLDEAHCISKWGHDFRPDYRYVSRFIREKAGDGAVPPVLCLTATAKPEVVTDILRHFRDKLGIELDSVDGGAKRDNLDFSVVPTTPAAKFDHVFQLIEADLPPDATGGAIVYCATRKQTEEVAAFLRNKGLAAAFFHAKLPPESKKNVQETFIRGELRVIAATNAFGMGIDKPDVRLVIHADIPGSLENYLQEAGRAGRDRQTARCVLLYTPEDVERQFGMSNRSQLKQHEIQAILKALRTLDRKTRKRGRASGEVVATPGEILAEEDDNNFVRDSATDDTRVRTAISWLEEAALLSREENQVQIFPSSLRVGSIREARDKLAGKAETDAYKRQLLAIVDALIAADADEGISTDELMNIAGLSAAQIRRAFADLERLGLASNDAALTAYVHVGVKRSSRDRLEVAARLEDALIAELRQTAPDLGRSETAPLHLRVACQHLKDKDADLAGVLPETLRRLLKSLAADGRDEENGTGSIALRRIDGESLNVTLHREWPALAKTAQLRRHAAQRLLDHLLASLPAGAKGTDLLAETTLGKLLAAMEDDLLLKAEVRNPQKLLDHALLWLHEQEIVRLNKGLAVFRPAMTIRLDGDRKKKFSQPDFEPLRQHYHEQGIQIHVMAEYVQRGLEKMADALRLAMDYFSLTQDEFMRRWLPGREKELERKTTPESWARIVESLGNKAQRDIVADERETANVLVLAGPGSGKTRVLVHRIAYLVRCRRENPRGILALTYNRHAAAQIKQRLHALIGDDARGVIVLTVHALAMRLTGASFAERSMQTKDVGNDDFFRGILLDATTLLKTGELPTEAADAGDDGGLGDDGGVGDDGGAMRERLLGGFRWILVDEYQDIGPEEYELIAAIAGRTRADEDKINLLAVGDDDQNIYGYKGASIEFIGRFEADYRAKPAYLIDNYRSTAHIIDAANALIAPLTARMKTAHPIRIDRLRTKGAAGGDWQQRDRVGQGRVQILPAGANAFSQAMAVMTDLERMAALDPQWNWAVCAVIAREWKWLEPVRGYCEWRGIPVQLASEDSGQFWRLRETRALLDTLAARKPPLISAKELDTWLHDQAVAGNPHHALMAEALADYALETGGAELPVAHFREWLAEWGHKARQRQNGLLLVTAHSAKGLEFDHVTVLDGNWKAGRNEDTAAVVRLYYVAMTRARKTLCLARLDAPRHSLLDTLEEGPHLLSRAPVDLPTAPPELQRLHIRPSLGEIDIGYAGRKPAGDTIHTTIACLSFGSVLRLDATSKGWQLLDDRRHVVGKMAKSFKPPQGMHCIDARVHSIHVRDKAQSDVEKYGEPRCERWEVVVPEFVFAPADGG